MGDNIKVVVKVRPLISRELNDKLSYQWRVKSNTLYQLDERGKETGAGFQFEKVYEEDAKTEDVYRDIAQPIVEDAIAGINGTIFAYGQTSSGKTFTMIGTDESPGIISLAVYNLFDKIKEIPNRDFLVRVSCIEIYNEKLKDLLDINKTIKIQESTLGLKVEATETVTASPEEVLEIMKKGLANRQIGVTNMNEESSRSHIIFQIIIESREHVEGDALGGCVKVSQLNLVDLAGSERAGQTGAKGLRFIEGTLINKSLSTLALVIKQLAEGQHTYVNYRDSKLTRILQNSLGGNAKTCIVCAVTPAVVEETISTLQFANRAKAIKNAPMVNEIATKDQDATMIQKLTKKLTQLQTQLESKKNLEQDNNKLTQKIKNLQKMILNGFVGREQEARGRRRTWHVPRRATISTLHPIDEARPEVPKFCTPALKYNSLTVGTSFLPIATGKMSRLSEEQPPPLSGQVTPPLHKNNNLEDEIIDLDSDDDKEENVDVNVCSPHHKCYESKTPPCVLRKSAKTAEKEYQDLLELTEREKLYQPSNVELAEELKEKTETVEILKEEVTVLKSTFKEKESEVEKLKLKIIETEKEIESVSTAKQDLEKKCSQYVTKLTDWEVSYETLQKKFRTREQELLSLLDEKGKRADAKPQHGNLNKELSCFLNISKEMSLISSDIESSILDCSQPLQPAMQSKISDLEGLLSDVRKKEIETLACDWHEKVNNLSQKIDILESENSFLKSNIENLESTIKHQKDLLDNAITDHATCNDLLEELQNKLEARNLSDIHSIKIEDDVIETMISNEQMFIANNENIRNLIVYLKSAIDSKNKQLSEIQKSKEQLNKFDVEAKDKEICELQNKIEKLQSELNETSLLVASYKEQNVSLGERNLEITKTLETVNKSVEELDKLNLKNEEKIQDLIRANDELSFTLTEKDKEKEELVNKNNEMSILIEQLKQKICDIENEMSKKVGLIATMSESDKETEENLSVAKVTVAKVQKMLLTLTGRIQEVPEIIDSFVNAFKYLCKCVNEMENAVQEIKSEQQVNNEIVCNLRNQLNSLELNHKEEILELQEEIKSCEEIKETSLMDNKNLLRLNTEITENLDRIKTELIEKLRTFEETLASKETYIHTLQEDKAQLEIKYKDTKDQLDQLELLLLTKDNLLKQINQECDQESKDFETTKHDLQKECKELKEKLLLVSESKEVTLNQILNRLQSMLTEFELQECEVAYVQNIDNAITDKLDAISNYVTLLRKRVDENKLSYKYNQENNVMVKVTEDLNIELSKITNKYESLVVEFENQITVNGNLDRNLQQCRIELNNSLSENKLLKSEIENYISENKLLQSKLKDSILLENKCDDDTFYFNSSLFDSENIDSANMRQSFMNFLVKKKTKSPSSLMTLCFNKIGDLLQPEDDMSTTTAVSDTDIKDVNMTCTQSNTCCCNELKQKIQNIQEDNTKLSLLVKQLERTKESLIKEQEEDRATLKTLIEPIEELQKKIFNHKTNLNMLTATTYAENRSLHSQVKVLQHNNRGLHKVCQKELPALKKLIAQLLTVLKGESSIDIPNFDVNRLTLPDILERNPNWSQFKNESTLDGDLLMLDTNVTVTTAGDNTLYGHEQTCLDVTQIYTENEPTNKFSDVSQLGERDFMCGQLEGLSGDSQKMCKQLKTLTQENSALRQENTMLSETNKASLTCESCLQKKVEITSLSAKIDFMSKAIANKEMQKTNVRFVPDNCGYFCEETLNKSHVYDPCQQKDEEMQLLSESIYPVSEMISAVDAHSSPIKIEVETKKSFSTTVQDINILCEKKDSKSFNGNQDLLCSPTKTDARNELTNLELYPTEILSKSTQGNEMCNFCQEKDNVIVALSEKVDILSKPVTKVDTQNSPIKFKSQNEENLSQSIQVSEKCVPCQEKDYKIDSLSKKLDFLSKPVIKIDAQHSPIKFELGNKESLSKSTQITENCVTCQDKESEIILLTEKVELLTETVKAQNSPCKTQSSCDSCSHKEVQIITLQSQISKLENDKSVIQQKYDDLSLEIPSTETMIKKITAIEHENDKQIQEIDQLKQITHSKNKEIHNLQDEIETLSNQLMESISEADSLRKDLDKLTDDNKNLELKCTEHEHLLSTRSNISSQHCLRCALIKDEVLQSLNTDRGFLSKLNRFRSDSESNSSFNKICTLQKQLHAGREDCKEITDEVATIKSQLECNTMPDQAMELDISIGEPNILGFVKDFNTSNQQLKNAVNVSGDFYATEKLDCINYYVEKTGVDKENLNQNLKIADVMKLFYNNLIVKHNNEVENIVNKLKDFEELKRSLEVQMNEKNTQCSSISEELRQKNNYLDKIHVFVETVQKNIASIKNSITSDSNIDTAKLIELFKKTVLEVVDIEFDFSTCSIFDMIQNGLICGVQEQLNRTMHEYEQLKIQLQEMSSEFNNTKTLVADYKEQLLKKESEFCLLQAQKQKIHEISNAVTLDIIQKEQDLKNTINLLCQKLIELDIINPNDVNVTEPLSKSLTILFENLLEKFKTLKIENVSIINEKKSTDFSLNQHKAELQNLKTMHVNLNDSYEKILNENTEKLEIIKKLTDELSGVKEANSGLELLIKNLESENVELNKNKLSEENDIISKLSKKIKQLETENKNINSLNEMITKEKENCDLELEKCRENLKKSSEELNKMTSDFLVLVESVKENQNIIERSKSELKALLEQNGQIKEQLEGKSKECSRLEMNIKTHEKTLEFQSRMVMRLQKQKDEDNIALQNKDTQIAELSHQCTLLEQDKAVIKKRIEELERNAQESSKERAVSEANGDNARRRRQSIHDSARAFDDKFEDADNNKLEAMFATRARPDDLFMDVDDNSNRSTPARRSRGRDSLMSRTDPSDKEEDPPSRPSSVMATRRRRQSIHDAHRASTRRSSSQNEQFFNQLGDGLEGLEDREGPNSSGSETSQLKENLASCQRELEELKEKYKELDEECDICAQYLRERDEQCLKLKKEKAALENQVKEMAANLTLQSKKSVSDASVNTDEDWANLHSVVVDRMSFDAEVEKNKKLSKAVEEFRLKNRELKTTLAKMHKAIENVHDESAVRKELDSCKQELEELKEKYKELDDECETCAQYLRERTEQCQRLKEAKIALEAKVKELQSPSGLTARKKRQSSHDANRRERLYSNDELSSSQLERDNSSNRSEAEQSSEVLRLRAALEQARSQQSSLYVSTGSAIVQNQQISDVMKENHKLKKMNEKLINICKKRGKSLCDSNRENKDPYEQG